MSPAWRRGEFHREMMHFETVQLLDNRTVTAAVGLFAARARAGAATKMHGDFDAGDAADDLIDHVDRKSGRGIGVGIFGAHAGIHEQAKMRVVDLRDVRAGIADQFQFAAEDRHASADEIVALRDRPWRISRHSTSARRAAQGRAAWI